MLSLQNLMKVGYVVIMGAVVVLVPGPSQLRPNALWLLR